jgi:hypothetical protein
MSCFGAVLSRWPLVVSGRFTNPFAERTSKSLYFCSALLRKLGPMLGWCCASAESESPNHTADNFAFV